jgi:hypothetical protein
MVVKTIIPQKIGLFFGNERIENQSIINTFCFNNNTVTEQMGVSLGLSESLKN